MWVEYLYVGKPNFGSSYIGTELGYMYMHMCMYSFQHLLVFLIVLL